MQPPGLVRLSRRPDHRLWLLLPALVLLATIFLYPVGLLLIRSVTEPVLGLQNYREIATRPPYAASLWNTVQISLFVTVACVAIGYPFAAIVAHAGPVLRRLLLFAVLVPFWSSVLVRTFAWIVLLQRRGPLNRALELLGMIGAPLEMTHNRVGVLVGMTHVLLPFMVLPLYAVMVRIDRSYVRAAASLGAPPVRNFLRVYLPLTRPGLLNGATLVFVLGLGYFITPELLGGPGETMVAQLIQSKAGDFGEWGVAGALAVALLVAIGASFAVVRRSVMPVARTA